MLARLEQLQLLALEGGPCRPARDAAADEVVDDVDVVCQLICASASRHQPS